MRKSFVKRVRITKTGKLLVRRPGLGHFLIRKARRRKTPRKMSEFPVKKIG